MPTVETAVSALTEPAPRQKERLSGSHGTSDIRISAPSKSMKERHLLMRHEIGGAQHDGISAKSWRAMFSATWSRQGSLKGVQFLVISSTKSVLPRPAGRRFSRFHGQMCAPE